MAAVRTDVAVVLSPFVFACAIATIAVGHRRTVGAYGQTRDVCRGARQLNRSYGDFAHGRAQRAGVLLARRYCVSHSRPTAVTVVRRAFPVRARRGVRNCAAACARPLFPAARRRRRERWTRVSISQRNRNRSSEDPVTSCPPLSLFAVLTPPVSSR